MSKTSISNNNLGEKLVLSFYAAVIATHLLVIAKIIPYDWVNGGMAKSYDDQAVQSLLSLILAAVLFRFVWKVATTHGAVKLWQQRTLYFITVFWVLGLVMQLFGTTFERYVMSIILLVGIYGHTAVIRSKTPSPN